MKCCKAKEELSAKVTTSIDGNTGRFFINGEEVSKESFYGFSGPVVDKFSVPYVAVEPPKPSEEDVVNNPKHYTDGGIETIDFIEAKQLNYNLGNVCKYISRAGKKDPKKWIQDLEKAAWYLNREIQNLKKEN